MKNNQTDFPPASRRTLQILDLFMEDPSSKTLKMISEKLEIPFTSAYRIVMCMQDYGYLVEDPGRTGHVQLGYKLSRLSDIAFTEKKLVELAKPYMEQIMSDLNQASQLCILTDNGVCTIEQILPRDAVVCITALNESIPINISASGKILTALLPPKERREFLKKAVLRFEKNTGHTIVDPVLFQSHLEEIERQGYGTDDEEYADGIGCIAVPIVDSQQKVVAAIGTTGAVQYYKNEANLTSTLQYLKRTAQEIGKQLS
ncbi:MAG: IclR family transcriptional regulator [Eubacteriales bacterium]|nr:IclR family transcriptional regulator [Eubacteriales bacterium]